MKRAIAVLFALSCMLPVVGCGPTDTVVEVEEVVVPAKAMLEDVAETGELGSASMEIRDALEGMKVEGDAAKADALLKELDELDALSDPNQIKKKASSMAGQL